MGEHVHVLEDGTVVKHSHTHTHENTKAVINQFVKSYRSSGIDPSDGGRRQRLLGSADPAFGSEIGN